MVESSEILFESDFESYQNSGTLEIHKKEALRNQLSVMKLIFCGFLATFLALSFWSNKLYSLRGFSELAHSMKDQVRGFINDQETDDAYVPTGTVKPNIIYILADDLGWNSIGNDDFDVAFATPVLSTLAKNGITLGNYYAQEVCTPSRASLLTGRYPLSIGMQYFMVETALPWGMGLNETTLAEALSANGYRTHMFGKWHLGHFSPRYLPTARGFDTYTGILNGEAYYWSKRNPDHPHFKDFMSADKDCYWAYDEDDIHDYSTYMYRDKAIQTIEEHDAKNPLFLFMSFQAVHDPFDDVNGVHTKGIPKEYIDDSDVYYKIQTQLKGTKRQQYAMSLYLMDEAVNSIMDALNDKGIMDNTYLIFSSDNGGCYGGGGKNGPLRGTKGSLFEGGVKVDSFIYSSLLPTDMIGTTYNGLFHISDWFPTIMELTSSEFSPQLGFALDGVSHLNAWMGMENSPRDLILYNYYTNVDFYTFDMWVNGSFAIRDTQYKLMHAFNSSTYAVWYDTDSLDEDDDALDADVRCAPQAGFNDGEFTYWLFDLVNDPYETTNLYYSGELYIKTARENLYSKLPGFYSKSTKLEYPARGNLAAFQVWKEHDDFIVPYVTDDDLANARGKSFPGDCSEDSEMIIVTSTPSSSAIDSEMLEPTNQPTMMMMIPTSNPSTNADEMMPSVGSPSVTSPLLLTPMSSPLSVVPTSDTAPSLVVSPLSVVTPAVLPTAVSTPTSVATPTSFVTPSSVATPTIATPTSVVVPSLSVPTPSVVGALPSSLSMPTMLLSPQTPMQSNSVVYVPSDIDLTKSSSTVHQDK